jgi:RNA polymerase sigma factor (sigma-70 family)
VNVKTAIAVDEGPAFERAPSALSSGNIRFDLNPTVDRIRVTSGADDNIRLNPDEGNLLSKDTSLTPADVTVVGSAYTNSSFTAFATRPTVTELYALDIAPSNDQLWIQRPANNGTLIMPVSLDFDLGVNAGLPAIAVEDLDAPAGDRAYDELVLALDLRDVLESLSPQHREVLELHYLSDMTQAQIAARLDVPLGTVKTRTFHALRALREQLWSVTSCDPASRQPRGRRRLPVGGLTLEQRAAFEQHLADCPWCRRQLDELGPPAELLRRAAPAYDTPPGARGDDVRSNRAQCLRERGTPDAVGPSPAPASSSGIRRRGRCCCRRDRRLRRPASAR